MRVSRSVPFLVLFILSNPVFSSSPKVKPGNEIQWKKWTEGLKSRFLEKFSAPTITNHIYMNGDGEIANLDLSGEYPKLVKTSCEKCPFEIKRVSLGKVEIRKKGKKNWSKLSLSKENQIKGYENIFLNPIVYKDENRIRVFVHDLGQKNLSSKKQREFYKYQPKKVVSGKFRWLEEKQAVVIQRSDGSEKKMNIVAEIDFKIEGKNSKLSVYDFGNSKGFSEDSVSMLLFRDYSNGKKTYGAGRFLNLDFGKKMKNMKFGDKVSIDFNYAYNPPCAVSTGFHCPLAQNLVKAELLSGEKYIKNK